jgi:N-acetyl-gamma-glutamyl-phosphate reductase
MAIAVGIIGGSGYTAAELLRLLVNHPNVEIRAISSRTEKGQEISRLFPNLAKHISLKFLDPEDPAFFDCEVLFFCTPHGVAMQDAPRFLEKGIKVIDLSADFRLKDANLWREWYGLEHTAPQWLQKAVYGLPEIYRQAIVEAELIANPGCYPTAVALGFLPLLANQLVNPQTLIANCVSGISGAGRKAEMTLLFCERVENFKAYGLPKHRHTPEINQTLRDIQPAAEVLFVPHLAPMVRGIHATLYADLLVPDIDLLQIYRHFYQTEYYVDVLTDGFPETKSVSGSNFCRIRPLKQGNKAIVFSVIDNLGKGAASQALQNFNLLFDLHEQTGLLPSLWP